MDGYMDGGGRMDGGTRPVNKMGRCMDGLDGDGYMDE